MIYDAQQCCLNELGFNDGGLDPEQWLAGERDAALGDCIYIACKAKVLQILQKVGLKDVQTLQICDVLRRKVEVLNILDSLVQTGNNGKGGRKWIVAVE